MSQTLTIDFISDIACPWCVIGLYSLEKALTAIPDAVPLFKLHPYELDASVGTGGDNLFEHISVKYDIPEEEAREGFAQITARGAELGFIFNFTDQSRVWNTFDAHRILHWAEEKGKALPMKKALFTAYFTHNQNPGDYGVLRLLAEENGLDGREALRILESGTYADEVRQAMAFWKNHGVSAVPTIRLMERQTFTGAQTVAAFEQNIRSLLEGRPAVGSLLA